MPWIRRSTFGVHASTRESPLDTPRYLRVGHAPLDTPRYLRVLHGNPCTFMVRNFIASLIQIKEWLKSVHFVSRHPALDTPRYLRERPGYAALPSAFPKVEPRIQGAWPTAHWAAHVND